MWRVLCHLLLFSFSHFFCFSYKKAVEASSVLTRHASLVQYTTSGPYGSLQSLCFTPNSRRDPNFDRMAMKRAVASAVRAFTYSGNPASSSSSSSSSILARYLHASAGSKKIVGVFYKANEYASMNPDFVGCVENALGIREWLESHGHHYIVTPDKDGPDSELEKHVPDLHVLITTPFHPAYVTAERIKKAKNLQLLLTAGIGSDHIDLKAAADAGLTVAEVTGSNVVSVAEDELMRILILVRNFLPGYHQVISGDWNVAAVAHRAYDLEGKTVGTVGAGRIGRLLLQRLKPFNCNLLYHDRVKMDTELESQIGAKFEEDLDSMLPKCDIIVINTPLTEKTKGMFDKDRIAKLKKGVLIVNNARGAIMDTQAVVDACSSGHIAGYSGDVWYPQPAPKDHPWRYMPNQAMTPHISGTTIDAQLRYAAGVKDMLERYFNGQDFPPQNYIVKDGELASQYRVGEQSRGARMGAFCNEDLSFLSNYSFASSQDLRFSKHVHDNVHGSIYLDQLFLKFIDTEQFQRLRDLKQLGMAHMVYPGAVHSRFEHSLGVYWLAGEAVHKLKMQQGLELGIDRFDMQTVKLAGVLHDIGHGPYSHLFEREFLPKVLNASEWSHEQMSVEMVDYIVDEHHIDIDVETMKRVKEMILASSKYATNKSSKEKRFLYDIVANGRNGIDVDKFDYIIRDCRACGLGCNFQFQRLMESMRVIGDEICYRAKDYLTIHKLFATRADLYRTVYTHAKVKAVELMLVDALVSANNYLQIASHIQDPSQYWKLDDTIIKTIETAPDQELKESRDLILRIRRRDLYQFCNEYSVPKDKLENFKNITAQDIVCSQKNGGVSLREEDVVVSNVRIDLTRGRHNPLESIKFFQDYRSEDKFSITDERISHLLPTYYQDMIVRVYSKKPELVEMISEAFENFQLKTYGIKAQVHATPGKKKRKI